MTATQTSTRTRTWAFGGEGSESVSLFEAQQGLLAAAPDLNCDGWPHPSFWELP